MRLCPACTHPTFFVRLLVPDTRALAVQRCPRQCNWKGARTCSSTDILRTSSVVAYFCLLHAFDQLHTHFLCSYATFTPEMIHGSTFTAFGPVCNFMQFFRYLYLFTILQLSRPNPDARFCEKSEQDKPADGIATAVVVFKFCSL